MRTRTSLLVFFATLALPPLAFAELKLTKSADRSSANPGDIITYTMTYRNTGSSEVTHFVITDPIPQGTNYIDGSARRDGQPDGVSDGIRLTWTIGRVPPGGSGQVSFRVSVDWTVTGYGVSSHGFDPDSEGDFWSVAWSKDGNLYTSANDSAGFRQRPADFPCVWQPSGVEYDVVFSRLSGDPNTGLHGVTLDGNGGCVREYGTSVGDCDRTPEQGGCNPKVERDWDVTSLTSVDGVLYSVAAGNGFADLIAYNGTQWCAGPQWGPPGCPVAPWADRGGDFSLSQHFEDPRFVDFGKDPGLAGDPGWPDGADQYVYAISGGGVTSVLDMYLGRVLRRNIRDLNPAQWEFVTGYTDQGSRRTVPSWQRGPEVAKRAVLEGNTADSNNVTWMAPIRKYIMIARRSQPCSGPGGGCVEVWEGTWIDTTVSYWQPYVADHLWGPWRPVGGETTWDGPDTPGLFAPLTPTGFMDNRVQCGAQGCTYGVWVLTVGDAYHHTESLTDPLNRYRLTWVRLTFSVQ